MGTVPAGSVWIHDTNLIATRTGESVESPSANRKTNTNLAVTREQTQAPLDHDH
jgi:hypothetical protein